MHTEIFSTELDDRIIKETGLEARVKDHIYPTVLSLGFRIVRVKLSSLNGKTLQIILERPNHSFSIEDCELASRSLSPLLDTEDFIDDTYHLEVSSPGLDRLLVRKSDFLDFLGLMVKVETLQPLDGRKRFRGFIFEVGELGITLNEDRSKDCSDLVFLPYTNLEKARLILTDELIQASLKGNGS